jgi:hypothetical protein
MRCPMISSMVAGTCTRSRSAYQELNRRDAKGPTFSECLPPTDSVRTFHRPRFVFALVAAAIVRCQQALSL